MNQSIRYKLNGRTDKYIEVKPIAGETIPVTKNLGEFEETKKEKKHKVAPLYQFPDY